MELFHEAGFFAWIGLIAFVGGIVAVLGQPRRGLPRALAAGVLVLGLGFAGAGMGQRLVDRAVQAEPDLNKKVAMLSMGSREAAANELLGGTFALILVALGAGVAVVRRDEDAA